MIFVTVGTQLPFDRLVAAVDAWAAATGRTDVVAQVGQTDWQPRVIRAVPFLTPAEFQKTFRDASIVVSHAGLGTIISALERAKPVVVMPRRAALNEHRNDHQMATARRFAGMRGVAVAYEVGEIAGALNALEAVDAGAGIGSEASAELLEAIRTFIAGATPQPGPTGRVTDRAQAGLPVSARGDAADALPG